MLIYLIIIAKVIIFSFLFIFKNYKKFFTLYYFCSLRSWLFSAARNKRYKSWFDFFKSSLNMSTETITPWGDGEMCKTLIIRIFLPCSSQSLLWEMIVISWPFLIMITCIFLIIKLVIKTYILEFQYLELNLKKKLFRR